MNTNERAFLTNMIQSYTSYTVSEIDDMSDFEIITIGKSLIQACQTVHGKSRSFAIWFVILIPVIVMITTACNYIR